MFITTRTHGFRLLVGGAAAATAFLAPGAAVADPPPSTPLEQVQALVQPSVVYESITWTGYVYDRHNDGYFTDQPFVVNYQCTGFVVNPDGYIGTAGHCVDYDQTVQDDILSQVVDWAYQNDYYAAKPSPDTIASFSRHWRIDGASRRGRPDEAVQIAYGVSVSGEPSGKALPARVVAVRPMDDGDVALLKVDAKNLTAVPLSDNANTGVGTQIVSIGYPASVDLVTDSTFDPSFKEGSISAEKTVQGGLLPVYEISAAVSGGMSGGPTTDLSGKVIGVNSFKISGETQPFNFVQPAQNLQELMAAEGVSNSLGPVGDQYRQGLDAYFAGDKEQAVAAFDGVLATVPSHQFAQQYRQKSQALPDSGGLPVWLVALGALVLIVVAATVVTLIVRRRSRTPEPVLAGGVPVATTEAAAEQVPAMATPAPGQPPAPVTEDRYCPGCGTPHEADAQFCPHCGHPL